MKKVHFLTVSRYSLIWLFITFVCACVAYLVDEGEGESDGEGYSDLPEHGKYVNQTLNS